ncbi:YezD family protein [Novosphingobium sp. 1949]|uniref:YezD family protein n=1 Tax=Novosphingobium organovorum TaxID=2930092 RepID=A0ABT0BEV5_9SPHN|nr:YezD family protein [Novosphingobium organovorum]MCJ2183564.1 YezD family protein [Novosphingobium organovorum]
MNGPNPASVSAAPRAGEPENRARDIQRQLDQSLASVREALSGLQFGNVSLTVHEGRVVQIDVTEKRRLKPAGS